MTKTAMAVNALYKYYQLNRSNYWKDTLDDLPMSECVKIGELKNDFTEADFIKGKKRFKLEVLKFEEWTGRKFMGSIMEHSVTKHTIL